MNFVPILTTVRGDGIDEESWEDQFEGCKCEEECSEENGCSCLLNNGDNYDIDGRIREKPKNAFIIECHSDCSCSSRIKCKNRIVSHGITKKLQIYQTNVKGFGLKCLEPIQSREFICEYAGECISENEVKIRHELNNYNDNYTLTLKEYYGDQIKMTFIDPRIKGNEGRFMNHSCDPNCEIVIVRLGRNIPVAALFAKRNIVAGEELCYDYGESRITDQNRKICNCGSSNCRMYLPTSLSPID